MSVVRMQTGRARQLLAAYGRAVGDLAALSAEVEAPYREGHDLLERPVAQQGLLYALHWQQRSLSQDRADLLWRLEYLLAADAEPLADGSIRVDVPDRDRAMALLTISALADLVSDGDVETRGAALHEVLIRSFLDPAAAGAFVDALGTDALGSLTYDAFVGLDGAGPLAATVGLDEYRERQAEGHEPPDPFATVLQPLAQILSIALADGHGPTGAHIDALVAGSDGEVGVSLGAFPWSAEWSVRQLQFLAGAGMVFPPPLAEQVAVSLARPGDDLNHHPLILAPQIGSPLAALLVLLGDPRHEASTWVSGTPQVTDAVVLADGRQADIAAQVLVELLLLDHEGQLALDPATTAVMARLIDVVGEHEIAGELRVALAAVLAVDLAPVLQRGDHDRIVAFLAEVIRDDDALSVLAYGFAGHLADEAGTSFADVVGADGVDFETIDGRFDVAAYFAWDRFTDALDAAGRDELDLGLLTGVIKLGFGQGVKHLGYAGPATAVASFVFGELVSRVVSAAESRTGEEVSIDGVIEELVQLDGHASGPVTWMLANEMLRHPDTAAAFDLDLVAFGASPHVVDGQLVLPGPSDDAEAFAEWFEEELLGQNERFEEAVYDANQVVRSSLIDATHD